MDGSSFDFHGDVDVYDLAFAHYQEVFAFGVGIVDTSSL